MTGKGGNSNLPYKAFHTQQGTVYDLPSNVKMADVLPPEKRPEISLERWMAATVAGEKCGDAEAVRYAREQKSMLTTSTGVLIPQLPYTWDRVYTALKAAKKAGTKGGKA